MSHEVLVRYRCERCGYTHEVDIEMHEGGQPLPPLPDGWGEWMVVSEVQTAGKPLRFEVCAECVVSARQWLKDGMPTTEAVQREPERERPSIGVQVYERPPGPRSVPMRSPGDQKPWEQ